MASLLKELGIEMTEQEIIGDLINGGLYGNDKYGYTKDERKKINAWENIYEINDFLMDLFG